MKQETCLSFFGVDIVHFVKFLNDFFFSLETLIRKRCWKQARYKKRRYYIKFNNR